jgi:hypothetical protein
MGRAEALREEWVQSGKKLTVAERPELVQVRGNTFTWYQISLSEGGRCKQVACFREASCLVCPIK